MRRLVLGVVIGAALLIVAMVALPASVASAQGRGAVPRVPELLTQGPGSTIGVSVRDVQAEEAQKANAGDGGVYVDEVREESPAARAGFKRGDIVVEFDGERVRSARHFTRLVRETPDGRTVKATVVRDRNRQTLNVTPEAPGRLTLDRFPDISRDIERGLRNVPRNFSFDFDFDGVPGVIGSSRARLGATLIPIDDDQLAEYFGVKEGLLVSAVAADSPAARAGLKAGDVLTAVNGKIVDRASDVSRALRDEATGAKIELRVTRDRKELTLNATLPERERPRIGSNRIPV